jgi:hypothetical protein
MGATVLRQGPGRRGGVGRPFVAASYLLGLAAISLRDYMLGTLAALPALLLYVSLGAFARASLSGLDRRRPALSMGVAGDGVRGDGLGDCAYRGARLESRGRRANAASLNRALK